MKKQWLPLVFAGFFLVVPVAAGADGSGHPSLGDLIRQLMALVGVADSPWGEEPEIGSDFPPNGLNVTGDISEVSSNFPPSGLSATGDEPEIGSDFPPHGLAPAAAEPEVSSNFPPHGIDRHNPAPGEPELGSAYPPGG